MPNFTTNYNFKKPLQTEQYDVDIFNENFDAIDTAIAAAATGSGEEITEITNNITNIEGDITNIAGDITNLQTNITSLTNQITALNIPEFQRCRVTAITVPSRTVTGNVTITFNGVSRTVSKSNINSSILLNTETDTLTFSSLDQNSKTTAEGLVASGSPGGLHFSSPTHSEENAAYWVTEPTTSGESSGNPGAFYSHTHKIYSVYGKNAVISSAANKLSIGDYVLAIKTGNVYYILCKLG